MNDESQNTNEANTPRNFGNTKFFIFKWITELCSAAIKHPGLAYTVLVLLGVTYSAAFFQPLGIPIFHLSSLTDFLLAGLRHSVTAFMAILIVIAVAFSVWLVIFIMVSLVRLFLLIAGKTELKKKLDPLESNMGYWLSEKIDSFLFWLILIVVLIALTTLKAGIDRGFIEGYNAGGGAVEKYIYGDTLYTKWLMPISGVSVRFQADGAACAQDLLQLGSTTDFLLFSEMPDQQDQQDQKDQKDQQDQQDQKDQKEDFDPKENWLVVPKSNILEILPRTTPPQEPGELPEACERAPGIVGALDGINSTLTAIKELFGPENIERLINAVEGHVTENELRVYIGKEMECGEDRFDMSEFIRFERKGHELGDTARNQVAGFMNKPGPIRRLKIFGFASPDGVCGHNKNLSAKRAEVVRDEVESKYKDHLPDDAYDVPAKSVGEDNPINGIANSRSVVIGACRRAPGEAGTGGKTDAGAPACSGSG